MKPKVDGGYLKPNLELIGLVSLASQLDLGSLSLPPRCWEYGSLAGFTPAQLLNRFGDWNSGRYSSAASLYLLSCLPTTVSDIFDYTIDI